MNSFRGLPLIDLKCHKHCCLWPSTIPQLCLGGPVQVSVLNLHSSLQEACDLHPTSTLPPGGLHHRCPPLCKVFLPAPQVDSAADVFLAEARLMKRNTKHMHIRPQHGLRAYYKGYRSSRNKISSQVCSANRQKWGNNEHNQLTNPKQVLFGLNGHRWKLNPTGFGLLS